MSNLPTNLVKHALRGTNGWRGMLFSRTLDVGKIISIETKERSFAITDRNKPYVLKIDYAEPRDGSFLLWLLFDWPPLLRKSCSLTYRYESYTDMAQDKEEIEAKQRKTALLQERCENHD